MARMGDWRDNKDEEIELDGIGGVNILVKADVHRSGEQDAIIALGDLTLNRYQLPMLCFRESSRDRRFCQNGQTRWIQSRGLTKLHCLGM